MKVYVLSNGSYEDWTIVGIFSSIEKANACKTKLDENPESHLNTYDKCDWNPIDEYELDGMPKTYRHEQEKTSLF